MNPPASEVTDLLRDLRRLSGATWAAFLTRSGAAPGVVLGPDGAEPGQGEGDAGATLTLLERLLPVLAQGHELYLPDGQADPLLCSVLAAGAPAGLQWHSLWMHPLSPTPSEAGYLLLLGDRPDAFGAELRATLRTRLRAVQAGLIWGGRGDSPAADRWGAAQLGLEAEPNLRAADLLALASADAGVIRLCCDLALARTPVSGVALLLFDAGRDRLVCEAAAGPDAASLTGTRLERGQGLSWQVLLTGAPLHRTDLAALPPDEQGRPWQGGAWLHGEWLGVPLVSPAGEVLGVLCGHAGAAGQTLIGAGASTLQTLAGASAATLARLSALEAARRRQAQAQQIAELSATLETLSDPVEIACEALERLLPLSGYDYAAFFALDSGQPELARDPDGGQASELGTIRMVRSVGEIPPEAPAAIMRFARSGAGNAELSAFLHAGVPVYAADLRARRPIHPLERELGLRSLLRWPVRQGGRVCGFWGLYANHSVRLDSSTWRLFEAAAQRCAHATERAQHLRALQAETRRAQLLAQLTTSLDDLPSADEIAARALPDLLALSGSQLGEYYEFQPGSPGETGQSGPLMLLRASVGQVPEGLGPDLHAPRPVPRPSVIWAAREARQTLTVHGYPASPHAHPEYARSGLQAVIMAPVTVQGQVCGVIGLADWRPGAQVSFETQGLLEAVARRLERTLERQLHISELEDTREQALKVLGTALEYRNYETQGHTERVTRLSVQLGVQLDLTFTQLTHLRWGAYLHDIGKVAIPDAVLLKPGRLNAAERALMQQHVLIGEQMVRAQSFVPPEVIEIVRAHHERWDGAGYPDGLSGEATPLLARVFSVADVYDALTNERPYKRAWPHWQAVAEIVALSNSAFDPQVVQAFTALFPQDSDPGLRTGDTSERWPAGPADPEPAASEGGSPS